MLWESKGHGLHYGGNKNMMTDGRYHGLTALASDSNSCYNHGFRCNSHISIT